jgi:hypothetical protein
MDCSLAVLRAQQKAEENREHEELKRRTLAAYDERAEEEKEIDGTSSTRTIASAAGILAHRHRRMQRLSAPREWPSAPRQAEDEATRRRDDSRRKAPPSAFSPMPPSQPPPFHSPPVVQLPSEVRHAPLCVSLSLS